MEFIRRDIKDPDYFDVEIDNLGEFIDIFNDRKIHSDSFPLGSLFSVKNLVKDFFWIEPLNKCPCSNQHNWTSFWLWGMLVLEQIW